MRKFDVAAIGSDLFVVVQAEHLLDLNSVIVVPVLPRAAYPALRNLTVNIQIDGMPFRIRTHMPLTVSAERVRQAKTVHHLSADEGQMVMNGLNTILRGL